MEMEEVKMSLFLALSRGDIDKVTEIYSTHHLCIDIDLGDGVLCDNITPLTTAAKYGQTECAQALLQLGSDLYRRGVFNGINHVRISDDYLEALVNAAAGDHIECVLMLAEFRCSPYDLDEKNRLYVKMIAAAKEGDFQCVESLLDKLQDKSIALKGWRGHSIMNMCLIRGCCSSFLQKLIDHGVHVNGWDFNGLTPLMGAIIGKNLECVKYLLNQGADVKATDLLLCKHFKEDGTIDDVNDVLVRCQNRTTLVYAICVGDIDILKMLLRSVSMDDIDRREGTHGYCLLLYAVMSGNLEAVSVLLQCGAEVNVYDFFGRGPLCFIVRYGHTHLFDLFLDKTKSIDQIYEAAKECVYVNNVQYLDILTASCDGAICRDKYEGYLIEVAVTNDSLECAQFLIENGFCGTDLVFSNGITALILSSRKGKDEFVEFLIKYGADLNMTDGEGMTAARRAAQKGHVKCLQLLMDAGADLEVVDKRIGNGTIFCDVIIGDGRCLEMLLKNGIFLHNGKLKDVHKNGVASLGYNVHFPLKNVLMLMRYNIFEWDWCVQADFLNRFAFAAVTEGYSPGKYIQYNDQCISLIELALITRDLYTVRYLLSNLYFLPDDFKTLASNWALSLFSKTIFREVRDAFRSLIDQIRSNPLSLQTWSFLVISKALVSDLEFSNDRAKKVNYLPIPEELKKKLKFHNALSNLCSVHWSRLGSEIDDKNLCNLTMDKKLFWEASFINCSSECRTCIGLGKIFK